MIRALAALICVVWAGGAVACEAVAHRDRVFTVCTANFARHDVSLHLRGADGAPLATFERLEAAVAAPIAFAMNAGMYHADRRPVGLYVEDGEAFAPIVTRDGPGNFGLLPNGVFCVGAGRADVFESRAFAAAPRPCRHATQSGPMLVIDGALHPRFIADSPYLKRRNGVGASPDGRRVHFVISEGAVSFHEMATLFRDVLGVRDALFLDGSVSRLYVPGAGRADGGRRMGPIVAVTEKADG